jgi:hypothetical protein
VAHRPEGRFSFVFTSTHGSWLNLVEGFCSKMARSVRSIRVASKNKLKARILAYLAYLDDLNHDPVIHTFGPTKLMRQRDTSCSMERRAS